MLSQLETENDSNNMLYSLPPFANEANKQLAKKIKENEKKIIQLKASIEDCVARTQAMVTHLKNVKQELTQTQALNEAKARQITTEEHLKAVAEREAGRVVMEIKDIEKTFVDTTDKLSSTQNHIHVGKEKVESIRNELRLEKEELDEWLKVQAEKEEDNIALLKYTKEDDQRIKELSLATEKLLSEVSKKRAALNAELTETQVAQVELSKTTDEFKKLHTEREELISKWNTAIKTNGEKDQELDQNHAEYQSQKTLIREKHSIISDRQAFLEQQQENNRETEKNITHEEKELAKTRYDHSEAVKELGTFQDEVDIISRTLNRMANSFASKKQEIDGFKSILEEKKENLQKAKANQEESEQRLLKIDSINMSLKAKTEQLEQILKQDEAKTKQVERDLKLLKELQFKCDQEAHLLKEQERNLESEITSGEAALRNLKRVLAKINEDAINQQGLIYNQEFQIQQLQRKIGRLQGERTDEEKALLEKRIAELQIDLEAKTKTHALLTTQLKKSQDDVRYASRELERQKKELEVIRTKIETINLYNESSSIQLNAQRKIKEELLVEENILRLELRKLRSYLNARADTVFSLENRHVQLSLALEERTKEIEIHKDMLRIQMQNVEEERYSVNAELRSRVDRVEKLKGRYEILLKQMAPDDGEEERSQAYIVVKAAQDREHLQRTGDELDAKIKKAEREILALENSLNLMTDRNESFRANLYQAELDGKDIQHKEMLETQFQQVMERYKARRSSIQEVQNELLGLEAHLIAVSAEESDRLQAVKMLQDKTNSLEADLKSQATKTHRAKVSTEKLEKTHLGNSKVKDIKIRLTKEIGNLTLVEIGRLCESNPQLQALTQDLMAKNGLQPPSAQSSRAQTRMSQSSSINGRSSTASSIASKPVSRSGSRSEARPPSTVVMKLANEKVPSTKPSPTASKRTTPVRGLSRPASKAALHQSESALNNSLSVRKMSANSVIPPSKMPEQK